MKLELTDIEFCLLTDLVYAGDWVINGCRLPDGYIQPYREMAEMIAKRYQEKKLPAYTEIDAVLQDRLSIFFEYYAKHIMYSKLAELLASKNYGNDSCKTAMAFQVYFTELSANDLKNVKMEIEDLEERLK